MGDSGSSLGVEDWSRSYGWTGVWSSELVLHEVVTHGFNLLYCMCCAVMSWDGTEGVPRFYMFSEDSASANVLHHQTSTVLEFWKRDRQRFGGLDEEFEGKSMSISD